MSSDTQFLYFLLILTSFILDYFEIGSSFSFVTSEVVQCQCTGPFYHPDRLVVESGVDVRIASGKAS